MDSLDDITFDAVYGYKEDEVYNKLNKTIIYQNSL